MENSENNEPDATNQNNFQVNDTPTNQTHTETVVEASASEPAVQSSKKRKLPSRNQLLLVFLVLVLLATGLMIYFNRNRNTPQQNTAPQNNGSTILSEHDLPLLNNTSFADKFLPDFSDMRGYAEVGNERWYAAFTSIIVTKDKSYRVYSPQQFEGITTFTGVAETNGQIWVSGQGGVALYNPDNNSFKIYLKGESNTKVYVDPYDKNLYVSTFNSTHLYDKNTDTFKSVSSNNNPVSVISLGFTKNYVIATSSNSSVNNNSISVFNKQTRLWSAPNNLKYYAANTRSSEVYQLTVDGKIIVFGRHVNYQSCEQQGKQPATVVYQLTDDGSFEELKDLTTLFYNNEAYSYALSLTALSGSAKCGGDGSDKFVVDLKTENGKVVATNKRPLENNTSYSFYTYQDRVEQLEKELGFASKIFFVHTMIDNTVYSVWKTFKDNSIVSTNGAYKNINKHGSFAGGEAVLSYVECGGNRYVLDTTGKNVGFGPPFLNSISKLDNNSSTIVYKTTNKTLYEGVDAEMSLANLEGLCMDGSIVLLGPSQLGIFDIKTNELKQQELGVNTDMELSLVNKSRDGFNFIDTKNFQLVRVGKDVAQKKSVPFAKSALSALDNAQTKLLVFNDSHVVIAQTDYKVDGIGLLLTLNAVDGKTAETTKITKPIHDGLAYDNDRFILQYGDGETKIINNVTHKGDVISKPGSIVPDSFKILKDPNSEFIAADGYAWFYATHWGIIGYKVP